MITQIMEEYKIMTTFEKIQELITEQLDLEAGEVKATTNIREDIDADSLMTSKTNSISKLKMKKKLTLFKI